jgi:hypothetical protein
MTDREDAWDAVHEALPAGWRVGPSTYDPGISGWSISARWLDNAPLSPNLAPRPAASSCVHGVRTSRHIDHSGPLVEFQE